VEAGKIANLIWLMADGSRRFGAFAAGPMSDIFSFDLSFGFLFTGHGMGAIS
jgi:hypothetical protein